MKAKQVGLLITFVGFLALSIFVVFQHGYIGFFEAVVANSATIAVLVDLCIALSLVLIWMWQDARKRGRTPLLHTVVTLFFGSLGPLLYFIQREGKEAQETTQPAVRQGSVS